MTVSIPLVALLGVAVFLAWRYMGLRIWQVIVCLLFGFFLAATTPWEGIVEAAKKKKCDLVFMASHGRTGLSGLLLGSQAAKVLSHSHVPVLIYR